MHDDLKNSGLADILAMKPAIDADDPRAEWLGKQVRFKRGLDWKKYGTQARDETFVVREVQNNHAGEPCVRIYCTAYDDTFGRCAHTDELRIVGPALEEGGPDEASDNLDCNDAPGP